LVDSILNGVFVDGWLPAENRLAEHMGVSRATLRAAMRSLEEEGMVTRQRGVGTRINAHVAGSRLSLNRAIGFYALIQEAGFEPAVAFTHIASVPAPPEAEDRLRCPPDSQLLSIERLFLADGNPVVHVVEMVVPDALNAPAFDSVGLELSIFEFADRHCRSAIDHTVVEIIPIVAAGDIAELLAVEAGEPLLRLVETHYGPGGEAFILSFIHVVDRDLRFTVVRRRW